jgi:putative PIN family toxin of toxin-antitoxin system
LRGLLTPTVSEPIFVEYEKVLEEVKREQRFDTDLEPWLEALRSSTLWVTPIPLSERVCRDQSDDKLIEAALAAQANTIIARDADLTVLEKPFGIRIMTPRAWLASLTRPQRRLIA